MTMSVEMILRLIDQATGPLRGVTREVDNLKAAEERLNAQKANGGVKASTWFDHQKNIKAATLAADEHRASMLATGAAVTGAAIGGTAAIGAGAGAYGFKQAIDFEKAMADVKKKVNLDPGAEWRDVEGLINRTSRAMGIQRVEMAQLAATAGQAGIEYKDLGAFMQLAAGASSAWDMAPKVAAQRLAEIKAATGYTIPQMRDFADKVNALGDTSAAAERDIINMFERSAGASQAANVPLDTTLAVLTALKSTGMHESKAATFFNAMASTLRTAGEGGRGAKQAAEGFKLLGLSIQEVEAGMKADATKTIFDVLDRLNKSPDSAAAGVKIFGRQWWDEAAQGGKALGEIVKNIELISSGKYQNYSLSKNLSLDLDTAASHIDRVKAAASEAGDELMKWALPPIKDMAEEWLAEIKKWRGEDRDLKYSPPGNAFDMKERLEEARRQRPQGEALTNYEARLGLGQPIVVPPPRPAPPPVFTQPSPAAPQSIPGSGGALPTFAGGAASVEALNKTVTPHVDTHEIDAVGPKAAEAGQKMQTGLNVTVSPKVDTSSIEAALAKASQLNAALNQIGASASRAASAVRSASGALHDGPEAH